MSSARAQFVAVAVALLSIGRIARCDVDDNHLLQQDVVEVEAVDIVGPQSQSAESQYTPDYLAEANNYNISNRVVDIFFFTQYCGPSSRMAQRIGMKGKPNANAAGRSNNRSSNHRVTYAELDSCCRQHDNCPNYITEQEHYAQFPGLPQRRQFFARMQCTCDGLFYQCLSALQSRYASAVAIGYGIVQSYCFDFEHPIVRCARRSLWRCEEYVVDGSQPKRWQWFDVPPAYKKIFDIPQTSNATDDGPAAVNSRRLLLG